MPFCTPVIPSVSQEHLVTPPHSHSESSQAFTWPLPPFPRFSVLHLDFCTVFSFITSFLLSALNNLFNPLLQFLILCTTSQNASCDRESLVVLRGLWGFNYLWSLGASLFCPYHILLHCHRKLWAPRRCGEDTSFQPTFRILVLFFSRETLNQLADSVIVATCNTQNRGPSLSACSSHKTTCLMGDRPESMEGDILIFWLFWI